MVELVEQSKRAANGLRVVFMRALSLIQVETGEVAHSDDKRELAKTK